MNCALIKAKKVLNDSPAFPADSSPACVLLVVAVQYSCDALLESFLDNCNTRIKLQYSGTTRRSGGAAGERLDTKHVSKQEVVPRVAPASLAAAESDPRLYPATSDALMERRASGTTRVGGPPQTVFSLRFNSFFYKGSHQDLRRCVFISGGGADGGAGVGGEGGAARQTNKTKRNLASTTAELRDLQAAADAGQKSNEF